MRKRAIVLYVLLVYLLAWSLQGAAIVLTGGDLESDAAMPWLLATMAVPALVAGLFLWLHRPSRTGLLWKPTWAMVPMIVAGVAIPSITAFSVLAIVEAMGWGRSGWFSFAAEGVSIAGGPWLLGQGPQGWPLFAANIAVTGVAFAALSAIPAIGEEFGWRAFLQQHLIDKLGLGRGVVLLGLIWSFFHLPGLLAGYNYPDAPVLGAFVIFPIELVAVSVFMAWLILTARSFWPAAIAHGAGNSIQEGVIGNLQLAAPRLYEDLTTLAVTVVIGLACWLVIRRRPPAA